MIKKQNSKGAKPKKQHNNADKKPAKAIPKAAFNASTQKVNTKVAREADDKSIK
jgi:hypothetical protein